MCYFTEEKLKQLLDRSRQLIATHGHMVQAVFSTALFQDDQESHPYVRQCKSFAYTIGRAETQKPDFIICDAPPELINHVVQQFDQGQVHWPEGADISEPFTVEAFLVGGDPVRLQLRRCDIEKSTRHFLTGTRNRDLVSRPPVQIYQVIPADPANKLPGEDGFNSEYLPVDLLHWPEE